MTQNQSGFQEYNIKVSRIGNKKNETETVGMTFHLQRYSKPFIGKYYIPCIVLIILTSVSFFVPPKLVPGRGGMLVTLFLVLSNTSSASKVSPKKCKCLSIYVYNLDFNLRKKHQYLKAPLL